MSASQPTILGLAILFVTLGLAPAGPPVQERPDPADEIHHDTRARMEKGGGMASGRNERGYREAGSGSQ